MGNNDQEDNGGRFEDGRGVIQDLLGKVDCVTEICTNAGAVRGNHYHSLTTQWTYVVSGRLLVRHGAGDGAGAEAGWTQREYGPGALIEDKPGVSHAWKATEDTVVLVFTKGPRAGTDYESDVTRLTGKDRLISQ